MKHGIYWGNNMHDELYQEHVMSHYRNPRNKRALDGASFSAEASNPMCGDDITLSVLIDQEGIVADVGFVGDGCAISQAATSMLTEHVKGKHLQDLRVLAPGDIYSMLRIPISPGRVNCALLSYKALSDGLKRYDTGN